MGFKKFYIALLVAFTSLHAQTNNSLSDKAFEEIQNNHFQNAIKLYTQLINQEPKKPQHRKYRAYCYLVLENYSKTVDDCNKALLLQPDMYDYYYILKLRGLAYYNLEVWEQAFVDLDKSWAYFIDDIDLDIARCRALWRLDRTTEAIKRGEKIVKLKGIDSLQLCEINGRLGLWNLEVDSLAQAKKYFAIIAGIDSSSVFLNYLSAAIYTAEDRVDEAISMYSSLLAKDNADPNLLSSRSALYVKKHQYDSAIRDLKKLVLKNAGSYLAQYQLAAAYSGNKNYTMAIEYYNRCLKLKPNSSGLNNEIAWNYYLARNYTPGLKYANKALVLDSNNIDALDTRGCLYYKLHLYKLAIQDFNKALMGQSDYTNSYYYRALSYIAINENSKACYDLEKVISDKDYKVKDGEKPVEVLLTEYCK